MHNYPIINLVYPTQHLLMSSLLPFQEVYESPHFKGTSFSREEFEDHYAASRGQFSYYTDWTGCNFPGHVIEDHWSDYRWALNQKGSLALSCIRDRLRRLKSPGRYYIVGISQGSSDVLAHEYVHALFYLDKAYARKVKQLSRRCDHSDIAKSLLDLGYHEDVVLDELNAYLVTGLHDTMKDPQGLALRYQNLFLRHFGFDWTRLETKKWSRENTHTIYMKRHLEKMQYQSVSFVYEPCL